MKKVNITVGRFQPFTKGHKKIIELMYSENGLPSVVFYIENDKKDSRHPFSNDTVRETIKHSLSPNLIEDCFSVKSADIVRIGRILHERGYEAALFGCGSDRENAYKKQTENEKYRNAGYFTESFKLFSVKRNDKSDNVDGVSATKARDAIKSVDFDRFRSMTAIEDNAKSQFLFNKMKEEINSVVL